LEGLKVVFATRQPRNLPTLWQEIFMATIRRFEEIEAWKTARELTKLI